MTETSERYRRVADGFEVRLAGVSPDRWEAPTPCTDWTVAQLVGHVVDTHERVLGAIEVVPAAAGDDVAARWAAARRAVAEGLDDPARAGRVVGGMFGEQPFETLVGRLLCADTLLHTWDLARATGQDEQLDGDAAAKALAFLEPIDDAIRRPGGFGPKLPCPAGADVQTALLSFGGRPA
ncbi:MAG TPA: TIGR03086 family metal-binding protein [Acidimicrobiales bacterium]|nr:TIGR03086 family metal-binding protein [Acidimicrobiales bacterium]